LLCSLIVIPSEARNLSALPSPSTIPLQRLTHYQSPQFDPIRTHLRQFVVRLPRQPGFRAAPCHLRERMLKLTLAGLRNP
jgi:hypothetical protein